MKLSFAAGRACGSGSMKIALVCAFTAESLKQPRNGKAQIGTTIFCIEGQDCFKRKNGASATKWNSIHWSENFWVPASRSNSAWKSAKENSSNGNFKRLKSSPQPNGKGRRSKRVPLAVRSYSP